MHKALLVLGLLPGWAQDWLRHSSHCAAHGELYTDLKKANLYYLLKRLAGEGCLQMQAEPSRARARAESDSCTL